MPDIAQVAAVCCAVTIVLSALLCGSTATFGFNTIRHSRELRSFISGDLDILGRQVYPKAVYDGLHTIADNMERLPPTSGILLLLAFWSSVGAAITNDSGSGQIAPTFCFLIASISALAIPINIAARSGSANGAFARMQTTLTSYAKNASGECVGPPEAFDFTVKELDAPGGAAGDMITVVSRGTLEEATAYNQRLAVQQPILAVEEYLARLCKGIEDRAVGLAGDSQSLYQLGMIPVIIIVALAVIAIGLPIYAQVQHNLEEARKQHRTKRDSNVRMEPINRDADEQTLLGDYDGSNGGKFAKHEV